MALSHAYAAAFADAWTIARRVQTSAGGLKTFRRRHPELDSAESKEIWGRIWPRAERVKYMVDTNQGQFFSRAKFGCPEQGNYAMHTFRFTLRDDGGNQFEMNIHTQVAIEDRIGSTNRAAMAHAIRQLMDSKYFLGLTRREVVGRVVGSEIIQAKCLIGGD